MQSLPALRRPGGHRRASARSMLATVLIATTGVLPTFLAGAIGVQLRRELGFGESGLGLAIACAFLLAAALSALFGRLAERFGPVRSMRLAATTSAVTMIAVAIGARSLASLTVLLVGSGIANAMSQPATNLYIMRVIPEHRRGLAFAIKQSAIPAATLLGGLAVPTVVLTLGWRWAYVFGALLAVIGAFVLDEPADGPAAATSVIGRRDQAISTLAVLGAGVGLGALAAASLGSFSTSSLAEVGLSEGAAGLLAASGSALVIGVRLVAGHRSDQSTRSQFPVVAIMLVVGAIGFAVMSTMRSVTLIAGGALAFAGGWGWPGLFNLSIARANPNGPAAASGVTQTGTYIGAGLGPLLFGTLAEQVGYRAAYFSASVAAFAGAISIVIGRRGVVPAVAR